MIEHLQDRFGIPNVVTFDAGQGGLTRVRITTPLASAEVYLHGAHVTQFQPSGHEPMLWLSAKSMYQTGKAIRGGVPICFPWFGPRGGDGVSPAHGFARISEWQVEAVGQGIDGVVELILSLGSNEHMRNIWPHAFSAKYRVRIGSSLELSLSVTNEDPVAFIFEEALHTYLVVGDVRQVSVSGLEGTMYIDKTDGLKHKPQGNERMTILGETDRVYFDTRAACVLDDGAMDRRIAIAKHGSDSTVVWNPWIAKSKAMADFGDDEWMGMICIETCNVGANQITLQPGATHELGAVIGLG